MLMLIDQKHGQTIICKWNGTLGHTQGSHLLQSSYHLFIASTLLFTQETIQPSTAMTTHLNNCITCSKFPPTNSLIDFTKANWPSVCGGGHWPVVLRLQSGRSSLLFSTEAHHVMPGLFFIRLVKI